MFVRVEYFLFLEGASTAPRTVFEDDCPDTLSLPHFSSFLSSFLTAWSSRPSRLQLVG